MLATFTGEFLRRHSTLAAGDLTVAAWCLASTDHCDEKFLQKLRHDIIQKVRNMTHQDLSNVAWAFARLNQGEATDLFQVLANEVTRKLSEFEPQNLAITAWAIGAEARKKARRFDPQCCANMLYSYGKLVVKDEPLVEALMDRMQHTVGRFKTLELCNAAWGISKMSFDAEKDMQAIATAVVAKVKEMNPQDLSRSVWAFANSRIKHDKLMDEIAWEAGKRAAQASTLKGSSDAPIETEETAEETAEVKSFEVAAAETSEMRNQPYNAADWMQPAAARWLLAPSSKLARFYFHIGPRCWSIATTVAVGATVLGRDSHPGYKLLASAVNSFELWDYWFHLTCSQQMHTIRPFWAGTSYLHLADEGKRRHHLLSAVRGGYENSVHACYCEAPHRSHIDHRARCASLV
eukprot:symbB.v1.2.020765.t2/scaffold1749.1/size103200/5